ncbi:MAG: polymer-forming cytoskeletal protein [Chloroflexi bacterium]|nr:polymer-forming cytoskeletal protein [Chloroflexota bacterium]
MAATDDKQTRLPFFSRFKRDPVWKEYPGYHVGDIVEQQPVAVPAGATIVGNIVAPQIMVMGLLSGAAIGRDVVVAANGEVWGRCASGSFECGGWRQDTGLGKQPV